MISQILFRNKLIFNKPQTFLFNKNLPKFNYSFNNNEGENNKTQEEKEAEINKKMNKFFQTKTQEIYAKQVRGYPLMQQHQFSIGETYKFKQQIFKTTFFSTITGLFLGHLQMYLIGYPTGHIHSLLTLIPMYYIPKYFLKESPQEIKKNKDGFLKVINSDKQKAIYAAMVFSTGLIIQTSFFTSLDLLPVFAIYNAYLHNLQQKNQLTVLNGVSGIAAFNFMLLLCNYTSLDIYSLDYSLFLGSVGNNLSLIAYTFLVVNQQKVAELAVKHGYVDVLNTIFASFNYEKLKLLSKARFQKLLIILITFAISYTQLKLSKFLYKIKIQQNAKPKIDEEKEQGELQQNNYSPQYTQNDNQLSNIYENDTNINNEFDDISSFKFNKEDDYNKYNNNKSDNDLIYQETNNNYNSDNYENRNHNSYYNNDNNDNNNQWGLSAEFLYNLNYNSQLDIQKENTMEYGREKISSYN